MFFKLPRLEFDCRGCQVAGTNFRRLVCSVFVTRLEVVHHDSIEVVPLSLAV